jgi:hypothetical protein
MKTKKKIRFDELDYTSIEDALGIQENNIVVKVWCHIKKLDERKHAPKGNNFKFSSTVTFTEDYNDVLESKPVSLTRYNYISNKNKIGEPIEVIGKLVKEELKAKKGEDPFSINKIRIQRIRSGDSPLRIAKASQDEIELVEKFIKKIKKGSLKTNKLYILNTLKNTIAAKCKIKGLDKNAKFSDSLETMIVQAFSFGNSKGFNDKIHVCVIGPSSSGKKLFMHAGHFLNYISEEAQPGALSIPGITGDCYKEGNRWLVSKGAIPLANGGLFGIQDLDKSDIMNKVFEVFAPVMEEGVCIIKKAGKKKYIAKSGIYFDINRLSHKTGDNSTKENTNIDTQLPNHIISRSDYICDFPKNAKLQFKIAKEIARSKSDNAIINDYIYKFCKKHNFNDVERFVKLLVAFITENYNQIDTSKIDKLIESKIDSIYQANRGHLSQIDPQFIIRFTNSIYKFVSALTRMQLRSEGNKIAVEKAFQLLSRKLDFMKEISPQLKLPKLRDSKKVKFRKWIVRAYGTKKFKMDSAFHEFCNANHPGGKVKMEAFRKRVRIIVIDAGHGYWRIKNKIRKKYK